MKICKSCTSSKFLKESYTLWCPFVDEFCVKYGVWKKQRCQNKNILPITVENVSSFSPQCIHQNKTFYNCQPNIQFQNFHMLKIKF